jgi:hypothetical protein
MLSRSASCRDNLVIGIVYAFSHIAGSIAAKGWKRIEGDQKVMRIARFNPKARGIVCAVKRANVIGARDQRTTSGQRAS